VSAEVEALVIRMARENSGWGYDRIVGALANLGHRLSHQTVKNILCRHGIAPSPKRSQITSWKEFLATHMNVGQLQTEFENPFESLCRSNQLNRTKHEEISMDTAENQIWLPRTVSNCDSRLRDCIIAAIDRARFRNICSCPLVPRFSPPKLGWVQPAGEAGGLDCSAVSFTGEFVKNQARVDSAMRSAELWQIVPPGRSVSEP
jgi:hypothetical protein